MDRGTKYGECAKHPGNNMVDCCDCWIEKGSPLNVKFIAIDKFSDASNKFTEALIQQGISNPFWIRRTRGRRSFVNQIMDDFAECWNETDSIFRYRVPMFMSQFRDELTQSKLKDKIAVDVLRGSPHLDHYRKIIPLPFSKEANYICDCKKHNIIFGNPGERIHHTCSGCNEVTTHQF